METLYIILLHVIVFAWLGLTKAVFDQADAWAGTRWMRWPRAVPVVIVMIVMLGAVVHASVAGLDAWITAVAGARG